MNIKSSASSWFLAIAQWIQWVSKHLLKAYNGRAPVLGPGATAAQTVKCNSGSRGIFIPLKEDRQVKIHHMK